MYFPFFVLIISLIIYIISSVSINRLKKKREINTKDIIKKIIFAGTITILSIFVFEVLLLIIFKGKLFNAEGIFFAIAYGLSFFIAVFISVFLVILVKYFIIKDIFRNYFKTIILIIVLIILIIGGYSVYRHYLNQKILKIEEELLKLEENTIFFSLNNERMFSIKSDGTNLKELPGFCNRDSWRIDWSWYSWSNKISPNKDKIAHFKNLSLNEDQLVICDLRKNEEIPLFSIKKDCILCDFDWLNNDYIVFLNEEDNKFKKINVNDRSISEISNSYISYPEIISLGAISSDGEKMAVHFNVNFENSCFNKHGIYILGIDENEENLKQITKEKHDYPFSFSDDNKKLFFFRDYLNQDLTADPSNSFIVDVDTLEETQLTFYENIENRKKRLDIVGWIPNSHKILLEATKNEIHTLVIFNADTFEEKTIYEFEKDNYSPEILISSDGKKIIFNKFISGNNQPRGSYILIMNIDGTELRKLTPDSYCPDCSEISESILFWR